MATILPLGVQYFDALGAPLAGGTLTFYAASTTTLKAIYNNAGQSSQLSNPLTLDSEGRIPAAGVWGIGSYRVRVKDSAGVTIYDVDTLNLYNPYDWTGLTASIADINSISGSLGTAGVVVANKAVVPDSSKNISAFGTLQGATLRATTAVRTPQINDTNNAAAITIDSVSSQVNAVKLIPAITGSAPTMQAYGSDTNIDYKINAQGSGKIVMSGIKYPNADGTNGQILTTNGAGVLSFVSPGAVKNVVSASYTTYTSITTVIPFDDTTPTNSEGVEILTVTITPVSASSTLYITAGIPILGSVVLNATAAIFQDSGANSLIASGNGAFTSTSGMTRIDLMGSITAGTTSATTIRLRVGPDTGTLYINGLSTGRKYGGVSRAFLQVMEV